MRNQVVDAFVQVPGLVSLYQSGLKQPNKPGQAVLVHRLNASQFADDKEENGYNLHTVPVVVQRSG